MTLPSAALAKRAGIKAVAPEGAPRDLDPGRRLAALVFGAIDHVPDLAHD